MDTQALWEAEFRGFFWGEGCLTVHNYKRRKGERVDVLTRPAIKISLRDDDAAILLQFQQRLGGHIFRITKTDRPYQMISWDVVNRDQCKNIVRILEVGLVPSKKLREVALFKEYLEMAHTQGHKYNEQEKARIQQIVAELRLLKQHAAYREAQTAQVVSA